MKNRIIPLLAGIFILLFGGCTMTEVLSQDTGSDVDITVRIDDLVNTFMEEKKIIGVQLAYTLDGESLSRVYGFEDRKQNKPMERNSLLRVGSIGKSFTAVVIMNLVENDLLSLDDPLSLWCPDIPGSSDITIYQLLSHTSGIRNSIFSFAFMGPMVFTPDKHWVYREMFNIFNRQKLDFTPGTAFNYSNTGFVLLSSIAEQASGRSLKDLVSEYISTPNNLENTFYIGNGLENLETIDGYDRSYIPSIGPYTSRGDKNFWNTLEKGAAGTASTAQDLLVFAQALSSGDLVSEASLEFMKQSNGMEIGKDFGDQYGLGLAGYDVDGTLYYGHAGIDIGFSAFYCFHNKQAIALTANVSAVYMEELAFEILRLINSES